MKAHIKIPRGWRRLRKLACRKVGDAWLDNYAMRWVIITSDFNFGHRTVLIRKARKGGKAK